ncbi:acetate--CoA ligase family protein [Mesorhizobium sp. A623]
MRGFFHPAGIAMIGASGSVDKMGGRRWKTLVDGGFQGPAYPVNRGGGLVRGVAAVEAVSDLPQGVDLAVIAVPAQATLDVVRQCAGQGIRSIVMISAGFAEAGPGGEALQQEVVAFVREAGMRMIGPNCAGIFSSSARLNSVGWKVPPGSVGLISQSGNVALDLSNLALDTGGGFSTYVSIGNAADVRAVELLEYMLADPDTSVVIVYLEGWATGEGRAFCEAVRASGGVKPVIVIRAAWTDGGRKAAMSHTRSLSGASRVLEAALRQSGAILADSVEEAWDMARHLPLLKCPDGKGIAILSDGGGHATLLSDALELAGLEIPQLEPGIQAALVDVLSPRCAVGNPVDFAGISEGDPSVIERSLAIALQSDAVDCVIVAGHFGGYSDLGGPALVERELASARHIVEIARQSTKPVIVHSVHAGRSTPAMDLLHQSGLLVCRSIPLIARLLTAARLASQSAALGAGTFGRFDFGALSEDEGEWLLESQARDRLSLAGIAVPPHRLVASADECVAAIEEMGGPVAMKLMASGLVHKSDLGGVILHVRTPDEARAAFARLWDIPLPTPDPARQILVTPMIAPGLEAIVGGFIDPQFGPLVMFGLGGVLVEAIDDVVLRLAPVSVAEAMQMLDEIKVSRLLDGYRGSPAIDRSALAQLIHRLSLQLLDGGIREIELNPIVLHPDGLSIADVRMRLSRDERGPKPGLPAEQGKSVRKEQALLSAG